MTFMLLVPVMVDAVFLVFINGFYTLLAEKGRIQRTRAFLMARVTLRWCLAQVPDMRRGIILPRSVTK
jgi:hypothetical protein